MTVSRIPNVEGGIQPTIVTAKGDLIAAVANASPGRLGVGSDGQLLTADSSSATGLSYQNNFAAGKNKIINGDFNINQRNFTSATADATYGFDRWVLQTSSGCTYSAQTFTLGTAPVNGYNGTNFARLLTTGQSGSSVYSVLTQNIESVRTLAGQTVTISFWAKAASGTPKIFTEVLQYFGTGGSPSASVITAGGQSTLSTSWARYSITMSIPSIAGKTLGSANTDFLQLNFWVSAGSTFDSRTSSLGIQSNTFDVWGVQVEAGSVATAFQTATGTIQGELAACQRYYAKSYALATAPGTATSVNGEARMSVNRTDQYAVDYSVSYPVTMRAVPTVTLYSTATGSSGVIRDAGAGVDRAASAFTVGESRFEVGLNSGVTSTANTTYTWQWIVNAEF